MAKKKKGSMPPQLQKSKGAKPPAGGPPGSQNLPPGPNGPMSYGSPSKTSPSKKKGKGKVPPQFLNKSKGK